MATNNKKSANFAEETKNADIMAERNDTTIVVILPDGRVETFGSFAAIFDTWSEDELGFSAQVLYSMSIDYYKPVLLCGVEIIKTSRKTKRQQNKKS